DDRLAELNAKLVGIAIGYGSGAGAIRAKVEASHHLSKEVAADRAGFLGLMGGGSAVTGDADGDLLRDAAKGKIDISSPAAPPAAVASLPAPVQAMKPADRKAWVDEKNAERAKIAEEINAVAKKRNEYIKAKAPKKDSFDGHVEDTVKSQAASVGLKY